jgi:hypothetical protein
MSPEDVSGSSPITSPLPDTSSKSDSMNYLELLYTIPFLAATASWDALKAGIPFGATLGVTLMVIMSNDSGEHPFAPFIAAALGFPIAIFCDTLFYIPCHVLRYLEQKKENID